MISFILGIIHSALALLLGLFKAKNSKEMIDAKKKQQEEDQKGKINKAIEDRDVKKIQDALSE